MPKTIVLFSSGRRDGNTGKLMDRIVNELDVEVVDLADLSMTPFDYEHKNRGDDFEPLMARILDCDAVIFASPVYWYSVAAPMKVFIDRISDLLDIPEMLEQGRRLRGMTGYVICTSISKEVDPPFYESFKETFRYLGMEFGAFIHADCADGYDAATYENDVTRFIDTVRENSSD